MVHARFACPPCHAPPPISPLSLVKMNKVSSSFPRFANSHRFSPRNHPPIESSPSMPVPCVRNRASLPPSGRENFSASQTGTIDSMPGIEALLDPCWFIIEGKCSEGRAPVHHQRCFHTSVRGSKTMGCFMTEHQQEWFFRICFLFLHPINRHIRDHGGVVSGNHFSFSHYLPGIQCRNIFPAPGGSRSDQSPGACCHHPLPCATFQCMRWNIPPPVTA